jgi:hypothetical protein
MYLLLIKKYSTKENSFSTLVVVVARIDKIDRAYFERNENLC